MPKIWEDAYLITFLKLQNPSFVIDGVEYTHHNTEITQLLYGGDVDQKCVMIEFISSEIVTDVDLKALTHSLIEKVKELINTDLYLIFASHNFGDRFRLYVDIKNMINEMVDSEEENDIGSGDNNLLTEEEIETIVKEEPHPSTPPRNKDEKVLPVEQQSKELNVLKLKLRNPVIFERVRDFIWYSCKPFSYPDFLWNGSYLNLRVQLGLDGFNLDEHGLKELYVDFCSEFGCTREQIEKDFSLRWKTKALDDIVRLNRDYDAAKYEKFKEFIDAQIKTLENTVMYT